MALPTSISSSPWQHVNLESSDTSTPDAPTLSTEKACSSPVDTAVPSAVSQEFVVHLSRSEDPGDVINTAEAVIGRGSVSPTQNIAETITNVDEIKTEQENAAYNGVLLRAVPAPVIATLYQSVSGSGYDKSALLRCNVTNAHQHTQVSAVANSLPFSSQEVRALRTCSRDIASITQALISNIPVKPVVSSTEVLDVKKTKKKSLDKEISKILSSADSNIDCGNERCDGTEIKCRKCGKIVPTNKTQANKSKFSAAPGPRSENSLRSNSVEKLKHSRNEAGLELVSSNYTNKQRRGSEENKKAFLRAVENSSSPSKTPSGFRTYSALLASSSRPIKKKGNRRTSVDVLYAREPSDPSIDKLRAKRRLSRQTDVSSVELMTLTEGNEPEDNMTQNFGSLVVPAEEQTPLADVLQLQMESIEVSNSQISPVSPSVDRIQELRAASSTESCPRAPWNSLETNFSSQDTDEKYINYEAQGRSPQNHQHESQDNVDTEDTKRENDAAREEEVEVDLGGPSDEDVNVDVVEGARQKQPAVKKKRKKECIRDTLAKNVLQKENVLEDWSTEIVILVALLVYLACKALGFMEVIIPARRKKKKNLRK
ncbi:hypothetical protein Hamer_G007376 [Homarus americanus]|uniref:Uncharacterized protein n=1 Tax=Homarus americanus TaxID=6706 RepID=A0A8J5JTX7_HOMAM|nr:hypothetical protein Hamer_G007376 [Homarus americanus]